jgi:hypothetical protein
MIEFNSTAYNEFIRNYRKSDQKRIIVFAGDFEQNRSYAIDQVQRETLGNILEIDLNEIITPFEEETYENIDSTFSDLAEDIDLIIFRNAGMLSGVYTGFTYSAVKYATPQEKYFLKKLEALSSNVLLEFDHIDQVDRMIERVADISVEFRAPASLIERIAWWAKNIRVNGSNLPSPRPH